MGVSGETLPCEMPQNGKLKIEKLQKVKLRVIIDDGSHIHTILNSFVRGMFPAWTRDETAPPGNQRRRSRMLLTVNHCLDDGTFGMRLVHTHDAVANAHGV